MFFFIFYNLWTPVTFDTSIRGDPSKEFWKENNSNFHMISITQNINFAPCDGLSQITSQYLKVISLCCPTCEKCHFKKVSSLVWTSLNSHKRLRYDPVMLIQSHLPCQSYLSVCTYHLGTQTFVSVGVLARDIKPCDGNFFHCITPLITSCEQ